MLALNNFKHHEDHSLGSLGKDFLLDWDKEAWSPPLGTKAKGRRRGDRGAEASRSGSHHLSAAFNSLRLTPVFSGTSLMDSAPHPVHQSSAQGNFTVVEMGGTSEPREFLLPDRARSGFPCGLDTGG